jgi:hypothetical protein
MSQGTNVPATLVTGKSADNAVNVKATVESTGGKGEQAVKDAAVVEALTKISTQLDELKTLLLLKL